MIRTTGDQTGHAFDPDVMRCLGLGVIQQQQIHVVFAIAFWGHVLDTVAVVFEVQGDNIYTDRWILLI